jgi:hypothetical protein
MSFRTRSKGIPALHWAAAGGALLMLAGCAQPAAPERLRAGAPEQATYFFSHIDREPPDGAEVVMVVLGPRFDLYTRCESSYGFLQAKDGAYTGYDLEEETCSSASKQKLKILHEMIKSGATLKFDPSGLTIAAPDGRNAHFNSYIPTLLLD